MDLSIAAAAALDAADPLAGMADRFTLPEGVIYLDGNSLGALPKGVDQRVADTLASEWGVDLIRSWNSAGWVDLPLSVAAKLETVIGAEPGSVVVADSTSVNLFKLLAAALDRAAAVNGGKRRRILTERDNFPTDNYIAEGLIRLTGETHELVRVDTPQAVLSALDEDVAVLMLTHVNYRNGFRHDMAALTAAAHAVGALVIWDLAHSAGAMPVELAAARVDFAVGCTYKYLNGGPGAPGYLYVAPQHLGHCQQPLSGWFAHATPFAFSPDYQPARDITQFLCGTPPVLSMVALDQALDVWADVDLSALREKSLDLADYFINLIDRKCAGHDLTLITPRERQQRGSQVSFTHPDGGYAMMSALIAAGVIGDFRSPDILRFGFAPLYIGFADVWHAADRFAHILDTRQWDAPQFHARKTVT
ncbi:MAG: kynureninase [Candidatus Puniceispirillaceae bacterium]|jgi:kynureninase